MVVKLEAVDLKKHPKLNEKWVQEQIANDPTLLGLGELELKDRERYQASGGRIDLLLYEPESLKRYEVEIQLGATDESHIIRTIEYWDNERRLYPQYEHAAVIVAEDITSRFLNVIQLFNGRIPIIALKMTVYKVGDDHALTFVKVLDELSLGLVGDDERVNEPTDPSQWERRSSKAQMAFVNDLFKTVVQSKVPNTSLTYRKHYIGLAIDDAPRNFVTFVPQRKNVVMSIKIPKNPELDKLIESADIATLAYDSGFKYYRLKISSTTTEAQRHMLSSLVGLAYENFRRTGD